MTRSIWATKDDAVSDEDAADEHEDETRRLDEFDDHELDDGDVPEEDR